MNYPIEKYKFYQSGNKVIAVSRYAGRTVKGTAKCAPEDTFDLEKGKKIAAARCAVRIAEKRFDRAKRKENEAYVVLRAAEKHLDKMSAYFSDAGYALDDACDALDALLEEG